MSYGEENQWELQITNSKLHYDKYFKKEKEYIYELLVHKRTFMY